MLVTIGACFSDCNVGRPVTCLPAFNLVVWYRFSYRSRPACVLPPVPVVRRMRARVSTDQLARTGCRTDLRIDLFALVLLAGFVALVYGSRLGVQPLFGEETRWATGAREMLATGDWIVPRQQGRVFAERPPMTMWAMAAAGWLRGDVDPIAIRLPSAIAVMLTTSLIFGYTRAFSST